MHNEKLNLETEIKEITKDKNELQIQLNKTIQDKHNLEELLKKTQEEKENIYLKHQDLINYNGLMIEKNKILEDENKLFHEKEKNIYYEMIDALFLNNSDINKFNISGKPILHFLCELGNADLVKYFISIKTVDINLIWDDQWKKTALNVATEKNHAEIVKILLTHSDINVNIKITIEQNTDECKRKKIGKTALHIAIENKNIEIVDYLLSHPKIDANIKCEYYEYNKIKHYNGYESSWHKTEKTPLILAAEKQSTDIIKLLLSQSKIILNNESLHNDGTENYKKNYDSSSEKPKIDTTEKKVSLHIAVENQDVETVKLLLSHPFIDANFKFIRRKERFCEYYSSYGNRRSDSRYYDYEKTALHIAIEIQNIEIIKLLISCPEINVNAKYISSDSGQEKREQAALHMAIDSKNIEIVKILLSCPNIDVNIKNFYHNYYDKYIYERTPLNTAIKMRNIDIIKLILENKNIDINKKSTSKYVIDRWKKNYELVDERSALQEAVYDDDLNFVKLLLENKNIDANIKNKDGKSLIELARSKEIKLLLIDYLNHK